MVPLDDSRYKYIQCRWVPVSPTEIAHDKERLAMKHRDSPNTGSHWMQKPVCFKSLKITHHSGSKGGHVSVLLYIIHTIACLL